MTQPIASRLPLADRVREARSLLFICGVTVAVTGLAGVACSGLIVAVDAASIGSEVDVLLPVTIGVESSFLAAVAVVVLNVGRVLRARAVVRPWPVVVAVILALSLMAAPSAGAAFALVIAGLLPLLYLAVSTLCVLHDRRHEPRRSLLADVTRATSDPRCGPFGRSPSRWSRLST